MNNPYWIQELIDESNRLWRGDINHWVWQYSEKSKVGIGDVWRFLYSALESKTGCKIPRNAPNKLDYVEREGMLPDLYRLAYSRYGVHIRKRV